MNCQLMAHPKDQPVAAEAVFTLVYPNDAIESFDLCRKHSNKLADLIIKIPQLHKNWRAESILPLP